MLKTRLVWLLLATLAGAACSQANTATDQSTAGATARDDAYTAAAQDSVSRAQRTLPDLRSIEFSALTHPERVSFSGTGKHATAVFGGHREDLGDIVIENYLTLSTSAFKDAVSRQLDTALSHLSSTGTPVADAGSPGSSRPAPATESEIDGAAADQDPYAAGATGAIHRLRPDFPTLDRVGFSPLQHPERASFSGTGKHAVAYFSDGRTKDCGDILVENYLTLSSVEFAMAVMDGLVLALSSP